MTQSDIIIGIDAGTSVHKAVAFDLRGRQVGAFAQPNTYTANADGSATQSLPQTWADCVTVLRGLSGTVEHLARRTAAIAVTGQGDGTWLVGQGTEACSDAWIWLDARAAPTARELLSGRNEPARFAATGTGLNTSQQGAQMAHMDRHAPEILDRAEVALHCKDWLFLNLTGVRATDPSEACFTFGNFRTRSYDDAVIDALGLTHRKHLLPEILDGSRTTAPLSKEAADVTGLLAGTPVSLGYVDMAMTGLGAGVYTGRAGSACSTIGSTGVHMRSKWSGDVHLDVAGTGYVICLPMPDLVTQVQTNMAATLNIDWVLNLAAELLGDLGHDHSQSDLVDRIDGWLVGSQAGSLLYHPYISGAGERGPFVNPNARAGFVGLAAHHRFPDLLRGVIEGLALAARDCYSTMGDMPEEIRLTGGAARSQAFREILAACLNTPVRVSTREEAGATGCAMMAAVAIGAYDTMNDCVSEWVTPLLDPAETADDFLANTYRGLFPIYKKSREALVPIWNDLALQRVALVRHDIQRHSDLLPDIDNAS